MITSNTIVRCRSCRTYINPFVSFIDQRRWKCNLCYRVNDGEFQILKISVFYILNILTFLPLSGLSLLIALKTSMPLLMERIQARDTSFWLAKGIIDNEESDREGKVKRNRKASSEGHADEIMQTNYAWPWQVKVVFCLYIWFIQLSVDLCQYVWTHVCMCICCPL